jgi:hypothetical protein
MCTRGEYIVNNLDSLPSELQTKIMQRMPLADASAFSQANPYRQRLLQHLLDVKGKNCVVSLNSTACYSKYVRRNPETWCCEIDPDQSFDVDVAMRDAARAGDTDLLVLLMKDVDPTNLHSLLCTAARNVQTEVVRLLLAHPRVNPAAIDNEAIRWAAHNPCTDVVRLLLADPRVNPAARDNEAIRTAASGGHTDVVRLLLADPRVNPAALDNEAIRTAASGGHTELVRLLSQSLGVDPAGAGR